MTNKILNEGIYDKSFLVKAVKRPIEKYTKKLYIILTNTDTFVGNAILKVTGAEYNHASLSLTKNCTFVYGFGRNTEKGESGFIKEDLTSGIYKQNNVTYKLLEFGVTNKEYDKVVDILRKFELNKDSFVFDKLGLVLAGLNIPHNKQGMFFCSGFIQFVLLNAGIKLFDKNYALVKPNDFNIHPDLKEIETGSIKDLVHKYNKEIFKTKDESLIKEEVNEMELINNNEILTEANIFNKKLYHGSLSKIDTLQPTAIDIGNKLQKPGWSLFCWDKKERGIGWVIMMAIKQMSDDYKKNRGIKDTDLKALWYLPLNKPCMTKEGLDKVKMYMRQNITEGYVYTIEQPLYKVGIGNDMALPEFTIRDKDIRPTKVDTIRITDTLLDEYVLLMTKEELDKYKHDVHNYKRPLSIFMIKDHATKLRIKRDIKNALINGEIQQGDDISKFVKNEEGKIEHLLESPVGCMLSEASGINPTKRKKIEQTIYDVMNIMDKSGANAKKYKERFAKMNNQQFDAWIKKFLKDDHANFYLEIVPFEHEPSLKDIEKAAKYLNIPLDEYVYLPFQNPDGEPIRTAQKVPVGLDCRRTN